MPLIDSQTVQRIKDTADIVEVVGDYVHLVRRGANYMGLCPFHNERTPSFSVNKRKNFCYCFSCKQGGSPVNFIMKKEGLSYHEALLHLARKYGIEVQERELSDEEKQRQTEREAMFVANEWAMKQMQHNLFNTEEGKSIGLSYFFGQRGITKEACDAFRLGYAIDRGNALITDAKKAGVDLETLKKVSLVGESSEGRLYDKYRGRVIFPILNTGGKVVGFGGRTLKNDKAKYINSSESSIYKKSNELYGIYQARGEIKREDKCYLVEGYFDVIGMWQSGMKNVVASSGTALTEGQIALIHRFTENITVIYDGDPAGIKAALRGVDMLLHRNMKVSVLLLPDGDDPDSFAHKNTPEQFREYVRQNETDVISFKAQVLVNDVKNDPNRKIDAIHDMVTSLAHIADPVSRDIYIQTCSTIMDISRETILDAVIKKRTELKEQWRKIRTAEKLSEFDPSNTVIKNNSEKKRDVVANNPKMFRDNQLDVPSPLFPLERKIMEFVVKYGYLPFCPIDNAEADIQEDNSGEKAWMNIAEFIYNELYEDNISISHPVFSKIFSLIFELKSDFIRLRQKRINEIKEEETALRNAGFARIAERNLTIDEIQREEKFLEKEIEQKSKEKLNDFEKFFLIRHLSNYEDDQIRETSTDLAIELYQLSKVYYRDNAEVETEEDRLDILVPRAIDELKSEILNLQLKALYSRLNVAANPDEEHSLLREINEKIHIRSILAKNLGERIVSPHGGEKKNRL